MASAPLPATASQMFDDDAEKRDAIEKLQIETTSVPAPADDFPDGGLRAWSVVLGASLSAFSTFGYVNAWGVFQSYYEQEILPTTSPSTIAWIGSIQYSLIFLPGLFFGRLFDLGYFKIPLLISSTILVLATFLVAQCTEYWQFLLCQGFAIGLASGAIFGPNIGIVGHWFLKRRGLAFGFTAAGSSIGGTIFPIAARKLIPQVGFPWTMRIIGFILILTMGIPNVVLQRRIPPKKVSGGLFNIRAFKSIPYTMYTLSCIVAFLGLYTVLTYIDISATSFGISADTSFYLVSIANAGSLFGRLFAGVTSDSIGAVNIIAPMTLVAAVLTYAWPYAQDLPSLIVVAIIYGFASGTFVSIFAMPIYSFGAIEDVGRRVGMCMTLVALGALAGPPISGAINRATGGYTAVGYYAGSMILVAVVLMLISRHLVLKRVWGKF
ncbi:Proton-linked Monocarboxylate Transporter [Pleurotus pulmonarius]